MPAGAESIQLGTSPTSRYFSAVVCPFCPPQTSQLVMETEFVFVLRDGFPVSEGHTLVVPKRHVLSLFDLALEEQTTIWKTVIEAREGLFRDLHPDGFTIGINDGPAAGQTVPHAHIHIIPRFNGDVTDP